MAKKNSKFNYSDSAAAQEINDEMDNLIKPQTQSETDLSNLTRKQSARTHTGDWTLAQCRVPNHLFKRMCVYCAEQGVPKSKFMTEAIKQLLEKIGK